MPSWICPNCEEPLALDSRVWSCANNHAFDCAKEGYVNLLPAHRKRSKEPGDNPEMVLARRRIHDAGLYTPLANELTRVISTLPAIRTLLDIGCGEGFYTGLFAQQLPDVSMSGVDIAKSAVRLAARKYASHHYAVASSTNLPVATLSQDLVTQIFAPCSDDEVMRVLRAGGYYLQVGPAPQHLWQLREALYDEPAAHEPLRRACPGLSLVDEGGLSYQQLLANDQLRDLIMATPFSYRGHREKRALLLECNDVTTTFAFDWRLFQKNG